MAEPTTKGARALGQNGGLPRLLGGRLCLHFANTVDAPLSDRPVDFLGSYADLARWAWHAGALEEGVAGTLLRAAEGEPAFAGAVFSRGARLRGVVDRVFRATAQGKTPEQGDLDLLWREYAAAVENARIARSGPGFDWAWSDEPDLARPLWPISRSAVELFLRGDLRRIKVCPGAGDCGWLFYDASRNGTRKWCSMEGCGSRVKMRRHYSRRRARD